MATVGYASLQIIPSVRGIGSEIRQQLTGPVADAGDEASDGFAKRLLKGLTIGAAGAAVAVGALLGKGLADGMEQEQLTGKLQAQLGATGPDAARYGKVAGQLFAGTMAESFEQGTEAIRAIVSAGLVPPGATNDQLKSISTNVLDLSRTFDVDLGETATAVGQLIRNGMAKDATEGMNLITAGLRGADDRGKDVLETFGEYSPVFKTAGLDGATAMGLLRQGIEGGARSTDNIGDAIKEFTLKVTGGGAAIDQAFKDAGLSSKKVTDDVAAGGPRATAALGTVLDALRQMPATAERAQVIQNLFGGPGEDLGASIFSLNVKTAASSLGTLTGAADATGAALRDNASTHLEAFKRGLEQGITNIVGGQVLPVLERGATVLNGVFGPAFGQAAAWVKGHAVPAIADMAHEVADRLLPAIALGAAWLKDNLAPAAADVAHWLRDDLLPAVATLATWLTGTLVPALVSSAKWIYDNRTAIAIAAGVVGALLLPALITAAVGWAQTGIAATVSAGQQVVAWFTTGTSAVTNSALSVAASYRTVGAWIAAGASAVSGAAQQVAAWVATGAQALWGMALQAGAAATVVGGWILMGVQSLLQAGRMAAAWLLAMGPVGWIIAAVVALVALIVLNWDTVKNATVAAWNWVWNAIKEVANFIWQLFLNWTLPGLLIKHWQGIKDGAVAGLNAVVDWIKQVPGWIYNAFLNFTVIGLLIKHWDTIRSGASSAVSSVVDFFSGLPGRIVGAIGDLGSLLYSHGMDVVRGLWNGISNMGGWLKDKLIGFAKSAIPGPIAKALGIESPSTVMRDQVGRWIPAGIVAGIESGQGALEHTMATLVAAPQVDIPAWTYPAPTVAGLGAATGTTSPAAAPAVLATTASQGAPLHIEHYYESDSGGAQQTAMDLMVLARGRG